MTIPCHNDAEFLEKAVKSVEEIVSKIDNDYLILIAEDGSNDNSEEIAHQLASSNKKIMHLHSKIKLGRGKAVMKSWEPIQAVVYTYVDCDLATDMKYFPELIENILKGYDLSTGSRYQEGAICKRPIIREVFSKMYNFLIRIIFKSSVLDHQCGFKAFSRKFMEHLQKKYTFNGWFWDTEAIILAMRSDYKIKEFPIIWEEKKGKRTPLKRLGKDVLIHGKGIIKLYSRYKLKENS